MIIYVEVSFLNSFSPNDRVQDVILNQLKLRVYDSYEKDEKLTRIFEAVNVEDVINKVYLDAKITKKEGHFFKIEKNTLKLRKEKQSVKVLIEKAVKTTIQIFFDEGFYDKYDNANEVLKVYLSNEVNERSRPDLDPIGLQSAPWVFQTKQLIMSSNGVMHKCSQKIKQNQT